jgi:predicted amidohydrolase
MLALGVVLVLTVYAAPSTILAAATQPTASANVNNSSQIQLVAVQMQFSINDYWTAEAFEKKIRGLMDQVQAHTKKGLPTLVVFPEDVGLMLVAQGMEKRLQGVNTITTAIEKSTKSFLIPVLWTKLTRGLTWVPALFLYRNGIIAKTYFDVFSRMAKEYGVYLVAGSLVLPPYEIKDGAVLWKKGPIESRVYNTSYMFGPDGKAIGQQQKTYLIDLEAKEPLDLSKGKVENLQVWDTPLGRVGIAICLDSFQDDVVNTLKSKGAQILVQPTANPGPWNKDQQIDWLRSSYNRAYEQRLFTYSINPMMNGPLWDLAWFGQSSIVARKPLDSPGLHYRDLPPQPGFIAMATADNTEEIVVSVVPHP